MKSFQRFARWRAHICQRVRDRMSERLSDDMPGRMPGFMPERRNAGNLANSRYYVCVIFLRVFRESQVLRPSSGDHRGGHAWGAGLLWIAEVPGRLVERLPVRRAQRASRVGVAEFLTLLGGCCAFGGLQLMTAAVRVAFWVLVSQEIVGICWD